MKAFRSAALVLLFFAASACAPGLFSMMTGCPSPSNSRGAITRTIRSLPPPAE